MNRYILAPAAVEYLEETLFNISLRSSEAAERVLAEMYAAFDKLAEMPGIGHLREDLTSEPLKFWKVHSYLIAYRPDSTPLQIARILSGYRDLTSILGL